MEELENINDGLNDALQEVKKMQEQIRPFMKIMAIQGEKVAQCQLLADEIGEDLMIISDILINEKDEKKKEKYLDFFNQLYLETTNFMKDIKI